MKRNIHVKGRIALGSAVRTTKGNGVLGEEAGGFPRPIGITRN